MANRFGRNQRRKMQAAIAQGVEEQRRLGEVAGMHHTNMLAERAKRGAVERELVDWAARIAAIMPAESAFQRELATLNVDAALFKAVAINGEPLRLGLSEPLDSLGPTQAAMVMNTSRKVLQAFALTADNEPDTTRAAVLFYIAGPDGKRRLSVDMRTLYELRAHGNPSLARLLLKSLLKPWMKGAR